ncbi:hypothetical protein ppKF707_5587 [Metapseudomonas furukawaii]|uniref:Uncharacterized protein n=1 Tax=Metapseudomonas furukawaii TaxID=1149133 RepID=A0AAD1FD63_METFU|nr:hypothetical protein ppKF707_5587 [Pseudomonas furukawaii]BAU72205.1 hypothetical protein KF707C_5170 [Pseudomonas furukawaii]
MAAGTQRAPAHLDAGIDSPSFRPPAPPCGRAFFRLASVIGRMPANLPSRLQFAPP